MPIAPPNSKELDKQFIKAAQDNQLDELKNLLSWGADIHTADDYALKISAIRGHLKTVKFLVLPDLGSVAIAQGANIHADDDYVLRYSAHRGYLEIVELLVAKGANIHAENDMALRYSAYAGHLGIVKFLITQGANIHAKDDYIFKIAAEKGYKDITVLLNAALNKEKLVNDQNVKIIKKMTCKIKHYLKI